ncbi:MULTISPECIES: phospho-N-acetylmuramoyl-pentapeptide-transferase [Actinoallomurus]|uniref:phospho-N-acetylmuramoyl-pentapeptide- transferase n=1 Tax=Actinoallomurus TaxID=667113 RepID=UPI00209333BD|nr:MULTISPECIES: phospho-N-acetylmuramoyl-pentapeptide-transferase [Actinoallomurus]MCO5967236.1 phospho-N-acetylmuramoyl-pentapeptide-transferase [Actinoallomurus soli]MCO5996649.1 phospho-N-acetylmuramoyl-pentapeptide-transferase [Actinoallomurus rhizosphaericola]
MRTILVASALSLIIGLLGTPVWIRVVRRLGYGQMIREEGPEAHLSKRGTPTMGGTVFIIGSLIGYFVAHVATGTQPTVSGALVLLLMTGLGLVGFVDDYIKVFKQRSLGLRSGAKMIGIIIVGVVFALLSLRFPNAYGATPANPYLSFLRDFGPPIGPYLFVIWALLMIAGTSNAVNLTDGLDGLAGGAVGTVLGAYVLIGNWQLRNSCFYVGLGPTCYTVRDPLDLAVVAAAVLGALVGFLWWNAPPARIFMGDTGSLGLGGVIVGLAVMTRTELLFIILGGLPVLITLSVIIQVGSFKLTRKRVFKMAPLQHHFELSGWAETTIVVRFWLISLLCVAAGLSLFYIEWMPN